MRVLPTGFVPKIRLRKRIRCTWRRYDMAVGQPQGIISRYSTTVCSSQFEKNLSLKTWFFAPKNLNFKKTIANSQSGTKKPSKKIVAISKQSKYYLEGFII